MGNNELGDQFDLIDKSKIKLIIAHEENREILKKYLSKDYDVITSNTPDEDEKSDMLILDEKGFEKNLEKIFEIKKSNISLYLPLILITRTSPRDIPDKYLEIIDEIVQVPIKKNILYSRIQNLLTVRSLFLSTQIYQKLTQENPVGICILFKNDKIKYVNNSFLKIVEKNRKEVLNKNIHQILPEISLNYNFNRNSKDQEENNLTIELNKKEQKMWIDIRSSKMEYKDIELKILILVDITEQKKSEEEIRYLRFHDQLTGLYNRDYFMEEIKRLDTKRQFPLTLIMIDINKLKLINDVYGHNKGDFLIKSAAEILEDNLREEDILARIGGDEFAIILPQTNENRGKEIIKRINKKCANFNQKGIIVSMALGLATKNDINQEIDEIFKLADDDMYKNKTSESKEIREKIIDNIKNNLKEKTDESKKHIKEIKKLVSRFADKLNLEKKDKDKLLLLAEIHDIGKISFSKEFFKKNRKLTEKESEKLKDHPEYGYRICRVIPEFNSIAKEILSHHERWDGKGYPQGLKGKEIPYLARIITIIDNYLSLKNDKKREKEAIIAKLKEKAGIFLDPELTGYFIKMIE
ncbi:MAG: diguanylate cyclase domain-containing protein [Bacillota bacterium]